MPGDPRESVEELLKTLAATTGVMLTLLWALTERSQPEDVLWAIRFASLGLVLSTVASILGLQFIVTELQRNSQNVTKVGTVAASFFVAWISFLVGCALLVVALFSAT